MKKRWPAFWVCVVCLGAICALPTMSWSQELRGDETLSSSEQALLKRADRIVHEVGALRGLPPLRAVPKGIKDRETLRKALAEKVYQEYTVEEINAEGQVLARLGLIPEGMDLGRFIIDLLTEQIAGYYDTDAKELHIIREENPVGQDAAMAHELFHALQDQHFSLSTIHPPETGLVGSRMNPDLAMARSAFIEGDATVLMMDFVLSKTGALPIGQGRSFIDNPTLARVVDSQMDSINASLSGLPGSLLSKAPRMFQHELQFPYVAGLRFIRAVRENRLWSDVNAIYKDPPNSTEQILHPERYLKRDPPTLVWLDTEAIQSALPKPPSGDAWKVQYSATMGELRMRLWLEEFLVVRPGKNVASRWSMSDVARAAEGWDGDRVVGIRSDAFGLVVVHHSVWDSDDEAQEYYKALSAQSQSRISSNPTYDQRGNMGGAQLLRLGERAVYCERWGREVVYLDALHAQTTENLQGLIQTIWNTRRMGPYPTQNTSTSISNEP